MEACPPDAPIELSDGTVIQPDEIPTLRQLCEIIPLILETIAGQAAASQNGVKPGQAVQVRGRSGVAPAPGFGSRPGSIAGSGPFGGPSGGGGGGGGGGFSGGGGGRGRTGPAGPIGPTGPAGAAGPGTIEPPVAKTDGDFVVASASPFVPVPGTSLTFSQETDGHAIAMIQAVFGGGGGGDTNGQIGLRVDGVDFPLTANLIHTFVGGVAQFLASVHASVPLTLTAGSHTIEIVVRGDSSLASPVGLPVTVSANPSIPLYLSLIHE